PAARTAQQPAQQPRLDTSRRTPYRYHQVPPPAPPGGLPRSHRQRDRGEGRSRLLTATVTPSIPPRLANPPNHPDRHHQRREHCPSWTRGTSPDTRSARLSALGVFPDRAEAKPISSRNVSR